MLNRIRRWVIAPLIALSLLGASTAPVAAYKSTGAIFNNSVLSDGLQVCFDYNSPVWNNRNEIILGFLAWRDLMSVSFNSVGSCEANDSIADVHVWNHDYVPGGSDCGFFTPFAETAAPWGGTDATVWFNADCFSTGTFYVSPNTPIPGTKYDLRSIAAHEGGHILGLDHSSDTYANVMDNGGPNNGPGEDVPMACLRFKGRRLAVFSQDDRNGIVHNYPSRATYGVWPGNAGCID